MKNDFNVKGISQLMGHAKKIITADVYGDTQEIIEDCLYAIEPFIEEVMPDTGNRAQQNIGGSTVQRVSRDVP